MTNQRASSAPAARLYIWHFAGLGGPAAILFVSRDTCSDSIFYSSGGSPSEGHNPPRGSRKFASQWALRGSLRGFCGVSAGSTGFSEVFGGSDPMLVTLGNYWGIAKLFRASSSKVILLHWTSFNSHPSHAWLCHGPGTRAIRVG